MNTKPARCFVELFAFIRASSPDGRRTSSAADGGKHLGPD
jgi:hypothetical protein